MTTALDTPEQGQHLSDLYRIRFAEEELERKNEIWKVLCESFFQRHVRPTDTLLDIACGYGEFVNNIRAARKVAVDLNPDTPRFLDDDVEFSLRSAAALSEIASGEIDVAFTSNFLEHLPDKDALDTLLGEVRTALRPGGRFMILGPNLRYLAGEYWDFYDHHLGLTHLSLSEALRLGGFEVQTCIDRFLPYTTQGALPTRPALVKLYLKVRPAWKLLGKQFFVIARKPA